MRKQREPRGQFYLREYPLLLGQIERLVELVQHNDRNVALLALFGSTARLTPRRSSDADLLVLVHDMRQFYPYTTGAPSAPILDLAQEAEDASTEGFCCWPFSLVPGDIAGKEIDEEFLENVAAHGVLLYRQEGVSLPPVLERLQPFSDWVQRMLAGYARAAALDMPEFIVSQGGWKAAHKLLASSTISSSLRTSMMDQLPKHSTWCASWLCSTSCARSSCAPSGV